MPSNVVLERVCGPYVGYYLASYAVRLDDGTYLAYCKVCEEEPKSCWEARGVAKLGSARHATAQAALDDAEDQGLHFVVRWLNELAI